MRECTSHFFFWPTHPHTRTHRHQPNDLFTKLKRLLAPCQYLAAWFAGSAAIWNGAENVTKKRKPHILHLSGLQIHWLVFISNTLFSRILKCLYFLFAACCSTAHPHPSKSASRPHPILPGGCNAAWKCEHTLAPSKNPLHYSFKGPMHLARRQIISSNSILPHGIFQ